MCLFYRFNLFYREKNIKGTLKMYLLINANACDMIFCFQFLNLPQLLVNNQVKRFIDCLNELKQYLDLVWTVLFSAAVRLEQR